MAVVDIKEAARLNGTHVLHSKANFDTVSVQEKKMPELDDSGRIKHDSVRESNTMDFDNPIVAEPPNSYKDYGVDTTNSRFTKFIKFIPSDSSDWLQENHPNAFLLLCLIAKRARRFNGHIDGLEIGMAQIGDFKVAGIESERKYRTAKEVLIRIGAIKIVETARKRKKSTTEKTSRTTTTGTLVILLKSDIWDINPEQTDDRKDDRKDDRPTTDRRPTDDEQEVKEDKKDNNNTSEKKSSFEPSSLATSLLDDFYSSLFSSIPDYPKEKARKTQTQLKAADRLLKNHTLQVLKEIISYAHAPGGFWIKYVHSITYLEKKIVTLKEQIKNPINGKKPQPKYNHDTSPSLPSKSISFAEDV